MIHVKLSLFTKVLAERPLEEAIARAADIGYDGVELMGRNPHLAPETSLDHAHELKALLDKHGLEVPCIATYSGHYVGDSDPESRAELAELEGHLEIADVFDCNVLRHGPNGPSPWEATDEQFKEAARWMREASDLAAEYDKTLGVEIHAQTLAETTDSTLRLLDLVDRENVGAVLDPGNMYLVNESYDQKVLERLADALVHVHVKDEASMDDPDDPNSFEIRTAKGPRLFQPQLMGKGGIDHRMLFEALAMVGYDGFVTDECHRMPEGPDGDIAIAKHEFVELRRLINAAEAEVGRA